MISIQEPAYAKLNLTLDVFARRDDGYHDLQSIFQTVSLHDDVTVIVQSLTAWNVTCCWAEPAGRGGADALPVGRDNLAWRAAECFFAAVGCDPMGLEIRIQKRIPMQAGLAGGSADAAAVLRALNRQYGSPFSLEALAELGEKVGSDVPFCVLGGTVLVEGRGERLTRLPDAPEMQIVICKPEFSISTPALFHALDGEQVVQRPDLAAMQRALKQANIRAIGRQLCNVFSPLVSREHSELDEIRQIMAACGAVGAQMTGTGSAVFGIFPDGKTAQAAAACLKEKFPVVFFTKTV